MIQDIKIIKPEELRRNCLSIPEITGIYDPLSKKSDGTVTPQAPLVISGRNLLMQGRKDIRFCLVSVIDYIRVIEVKCVYVYSDRKIILSLPELELGEYFPAINMPDEDGLESVYIFPMSWIIRVWPYNRMSEVYQ